MSAACIMPIHMCVCSHYLCFVQTLYDLCTATYGLHTGSLCADCGLCLCYSRFVQTEVHDMYFCRSFIAVNELCCLNTVLF